MFSVAPVWKAGLDVLAKNKGLSLALPGLIRTVGSQHTSSMKTRSVWWSNWPKKDFSLGGISLFSPLPL